MGGWGKKERKKNGIPHFPCLPSPPLPSSRDYSRNLSKVKMRNEGLNNGISAALITFNDPLLITI